MFVLKDGKPDVIKRGELPKKLAELRNEKGKLVYDRTNITNTLYKLDFLDYIISKKKVVLSSQ